MNRPTLKQVGSAQQFLRWYWLKEELYEYCKSNALPTSGSKPELAQRIVAHLSGAPIPPVKRSVRAGAMPTTFELSTVIGHGWRCNPSLGQFFRTHCGRGFRFNAATRNFVHTKEGSTLAQAIDCYKASVAVGAPKQEIIAQNEYNRHTREFFAANPHATREQALQTWWLKRNTQKPNLSKKIKISMKT
jgi:hypothetical protein